MDIPTYYRVRFFGHEHSLCGVCHVPVPVYVHRHIFVQCCRLRGKAHQQRSISVFSGRIILGSGQGELILIVTCLGQFHTCLPVAWCFRKDPGHLICKIIFQICCKFVTLQSFCIHPSKVSGNSGQETRFHSISLSIQYYGTLSTQLCTLHQLCY